MSVNEEVFGNKFCLIHKSGAKLFPVRLKNRESGTLAFRLSKGGEAGNTKGAGYEEHDETVVLQRVIHDGWAVRVASRDRLIAGLYKLGQRSIDGFLLNAS